MDRTGGVPSQVSKEGGCYYTTHPSRRSALLYCYPHPHPTPGKKLRREIIFRQKFNISSKNNGYFSGNFTYKHAKMPHFFGAAKGGEFFLGGSKCLLATKREDLATFCVSPSVRPFVHVCTCLVIRHLVVLV